ncbi:MAG: 30S ribosomal protein S6 [Candidatus Colwellbacteria bacterium]|nr:30S ribosomal protein S6 [Candidatus Colwellbacteria bacterium]
MSEEIKKEYEISFLAASEDGARHIGDILSKMDVAVIVASPVSLIQLAYPILKRNQAYFGYIRFDSSAVNAVELDKKLRLDADILRYLIITSPPTQRTSKYKSAAASSKKKTVKAGPQLSNEALQAEIAALQNNNTTDKI